MSWLLVFVLTGFAHVRAETPKYKLQPLEYNHPGLVVDLGVGLWAYPLPMDYDRDGDMDLLVACPDKPSSGVYFFENPTQDPAVKLPVFKPAVWIGPAKHYMMLSEIDGEPVILQQNQLFRRDAAKGKFDFTKPTKIEAPANPHAKSGGRIRGNMWRQVDFDGDGDHDLIIGVGDWSDLGWDHAYDNHGRWRNGPLHGYVYLVENLGSNESPRYRQQGERLRAGGGDVDVYGWPSPNVADFDGDGDLDLLCGEFLDGFTYFQNTGSRVAPEHAAGVKLRSSDGDPLIMHLQMITPTAIDWDRDGDLDLIVGDEDGRVALVENTGKLKHQVPVFQPPVYFRQTADTLKFGALATPTVYDWDGDGDEDILCGNTAGSIGWFENLGVGESGMPRWNAPVQLHVKTPDGSKPFRVMAGESGSIQGPCEAKWGYTTLSVADWDRDGDGDILYNSILGRVGLIRNDSGELVETEFDTGRSELPPRWSWQQRPAPDTLTQWRTTPLATDFDRDGTLDLVMLDQEGYLTLRRGGQQAERVFVTEGGLPFRANPGTCGRSGRVKLAVVDWDGDGRDDVLVNSENATWYRNLEDRNGNVVLKRVGNLARRNVAGHTSSPAVCDFNRDGKPDLLVGSENGRIYHIAHEDCVSFSREQITPEVNRSKPKATAIVLQEDVFGNPPFKSCHASSICETSRGLVAAWFGGTKEGDQDVCIWTSYHDGIRWSRPSIAATGIQHASLRYPCWNPVLYQPPGDAATLLFYKVGPSPERWWGEVQVSYDRGRSFRNPRRLPESILGPVRCKPILLDDSETLLCGSSTEEDGWKVHFESVRLVNGQPDSTWNRFGPLDGEEDFDAIQPTLLRHRDGRIQALCRTRQSKIASTFSADEGKTWSPLRATDLPNPNSGIDAVTLRDGRHLLVYNPLDAGEKGWGKRSVLSVAISDDGEAWRPLVQLENERDAEFSYPAIIQSQDDLVHVTYTYKRQRIKHVVLNPETIE
ncbi:MAG: exo-alpha-sialidase [Planctomycetota bacterium]